uniref:Secreted protein n=1 Tax=Pyxicephalus adspersus TaxID=30357 RepID=A0AAV3B2J3_PYXAD|nr:TPA: hypothetical protein GDO54_009158 [Pyxicephalus adspersus]
MLLQLIFTPFPPTLFSARNVLIFLKICLFFKDMNTSNYRPLYRQPQVFRVSLSVVYTYLHFRWREESSVVCVFHFFPISSLTLPPYMV